MHISPRELAYCGLFGAASLLLPMLFHVLQLGPVFMPMYLPLVTLAFFVRPLLAALTAMLTPILSGAVLGMPPLFPPIAPVMAIELGLMAALIAFCVRRWPRLNAWVVLLPILLTGRALHVAMMFLVASFIQLPAGVMAGVSFLTGWPGIILMLVVVPPIAKVGRELARSNTSSRERIPE